MTLSPPLVKGALASYPSDAPGQAPDTIVFQYNPATLRRSLAARKPPAATAPKRGSRLDRLRVAGPPVETVTLSVELDATDQLERPDEHPEIAANGLHAALARLELLMYPSSVDARKLEQMAARGKVQVKSATVPLTLLIWGASRVVPVQLKSFAITEQAFDTRLNPIRAKVDLTMEVLTYVEFPDRSLGRDTFIAYQKQKEALARAGGSPLPRIGG